MPQAVADHLVGPLVVDVDLERPGIACDEDGLADRLEVVADRIEIERLARVRLEQVHRLVAEALVGVGDQRRRLGSRPRPAGRGSGRGPPEEMKQRALEQPVDALAARVDDAGLAQDREQGRRPRDRLLGRLDGRAQDGLDVVGPLRGDDRRLGRFADDRQDRALDRLRDRAVGRLRAPRERVGEIEAVEPGLAGEPLGHAAEDLARDHAGVAAGPHQRAEGDRRRDALDRHLRDGFGLVERGLDRRVHVRAGIAVRHRVDVEAVDLLDVGLEVGDRRPERVEKTLAVAGPADHQATSVPLAARSSLRTPDLSDRSRGQIARLIAEAVDVDRQPRDLAAERPAERVANGRIDLPGDLGDRDAVGHGQVEIDGEGVMID